MFDCPPCHYEYVVPTWENQLDEIMLEFCSYNNIDRKELLAFLKKIVKELQEIDELD